jgi:ribose 5-phosphate isomerase B
VLALRAREAGSDPYEEIINAFLSVEFEGGRHQKRLDKITRIEKKVKES